MQISQRPRSVAGNGRIAPTTAHAATQHIDDATRPATSLHLFKTLNERLDQVLTAGPAILYTTGLDDPMQDTFVSANVQRILGIPASRFLDEPGFFRSRVHPDDLAMVEQKLGELGSDVVASQYRFRDGHDEYRWLHDQAQVVTSESGASQIVGFYTDVTDSVVAAERGEHRFRSMVQHSSDMLVVLDEKAQVIYQSPAVERTLGYARQPDGGTLATHPDDGPHMAAIFADLLRTPGATSTLTFRMKHADGSWLLIEGVARNLLHDEAVGGIVINGRDITKRHTAEEQVRFQAQLLEQVDNAVIATDRERSILFWNAGAERLYGWSREEVLGQDVRLFLPYSEALARQVETSVLGGLAWTGEIMHRRRDGTVIWVSATDSPILDLAGQVIGGIGVSVDVSERREAREALARSDARFRALVQNSSDAIAVVSADTTVLYTSPATEELVGTSAGELMATRLMLLVHPDDRLRAKEALGRVLTSPRADVKVDLRIVRADGTWRDVEVIADNRLDDPAVNGIVINARDITERKRAFSMLEMQTGLLNLVARGMPIGETLHALAGMLEVNIPGARCSVRFTSTGPLSRELATAGVASIASEGCGALRPGVAGGGPATAARTRQAVVIEDLRVHPASKRWADRLRGQGYLSCWSFPVVAYASDELIGVLVLYFGSTRSPTTSELEVIEMAKRLIVVAVERARQAERLAHQALHDPLTALPNRLLLSDRLEQALARMPRASGQVGVIFLDLDDFKLVNDSLGHAAGDRLLVTVGERLAATVRAGDTVARFGGDEFVILCEALSDEHEAISLAKRVLKAVTEPITLRRKRVRVTASIGVAIGGRAGGTGEALLRDADAAMYRAKERGRDRVELFDSAMHQRAKTRLDTEAALSAAVDGGQLRLHYQPQVSLVTGETIGVEALVRWQHPQRGLLMPAEFIPFAEESGLIVPLGEWVLREAVKQIASWQDRGFHVPVCVNVSAKQLMDTSFHTLVESLLQESGLAPSSLVIEVTESVLVEEEEPVSECIQRIIQLGAAISIDDFGTGYSSLLYLKRFPASMIKVDMSFVHGSENLRDQAIVRAVVGLANDLSITTVAEGVETEAQEAVLRSLGCEAAQGYLFAKPADAEATWAWMRRRRPLVA